MFITQYEHKMYINIYIYIDMITINYIYVIIYVNIYMCRVMLIWHSHCSITLDNYVCI